MCVSRSLAKPSAESPNIRRLSPGYCIRVHRNKTPSLMPGLADLMGVANDVSPRRDPSPANQPISLLTVSFGSGWGANYGHKSVAELQCRYEVIFT